MRACWLKWVGRDWSISADYIWLNYSDANTVHIGVANPVSAGALFTYLGPDLARAGPLPSTNNMIEGGVNSQLRAVLRNHRGLTSVKRVKAVFWWCLAHSGDARTARGKPAAMPTDADIDFLFSVYSASPSRDDGGPEWGDRAVWEDLHHRDPYPFWLD